MRHRRFVGFLLAGVMLLTSAITFPDRMLVPDAIIEAKALTNSEITAAITNLKNTRYPEGYCWNNEYSDAQATKLFNGSQCVGFARNIGNLVFGSFPNSRISNYSTCQTLNGWTAVRASDVTSVEAGDIIRTNNHAAIVHYVDGSNIYVAEAWGSSGNTIHYGYFNGTRKNATLAQIKAGSDTFLGVWKHPGNTGPIINDPGTAPTEAWIWSNKTTVAVNEEISFNFNAINAEWFVLGIYKDNVFQPIIDNGTSDWYTTSFSEPGKYSIHAACYNKNGHTDSPELEFTVYDTVPSEAWIWSNKSIVKVGEEISFNFNAINATYFVLGIYKDGVFQPIIDNGASDWYITSFSEPGQYAIHAACYNGVGHTDSPELYFTVYDKAPAVAILQIDKEKYKVGEKIQFTAKSENAIDYFIGIDKDGERIKTEEMKNGTLSLTFDKVGEYSAYVTASNELGYCDSKPIKFTIYNSYTISFDPNGGTCTQKNKTVNYGETYGTLPTPTRDGYEFTGWYTKATDGSKITSDTNVTTTSSQTLYAHWKMLPIKGDTNGDNKLTLTDLILLQKHLLTSATLTAPGNADLNADGVIDVFDLALLKRLLLKK